MAEKGSHKEKRERDALNLIYDERAFFSIRHSDSPDFLLQYSETSNPFGVEVTEMHASEAAARVTHLPGYALELIDGAAYRHRDDPSLLIVDTVEFTSADGTKHSTRALIQKPPPFDVYRELLRSTIAAKNAKATTYDKGTSHTNLIIIDHINPMILAEPKATYTLLFTEGVRESVMMSPFAEIYLITRLKTGHQEGSQRCSVPLRMFFLLGSVYQFSGALEEFLPKDADHFMDDVLYGLFDYLRGKHVPVRLHEPADGCEILLGNTGIRIEGNGYIFVHDYADTTRKIVGEIQPERSGPWRDPKFEESFASYRRTHIFECSVAFPVRENAKTVPHAGKPLSR